jgi:hypothetical protein
VLAEGLLVVERLSRADAFDVFDEGCAAKTIRPDRRHVHQVARRLRRKARLLLALTDREASCRSP